MFYATLIITLITIWWKDVPQEVAEYLPYYTEASFTPYWFDETVPDSIHRIDTFSFLNQAGNEITNHDVTGKISVANFFFTICPGICPRLTRSMQRVQDAFAEDDLVVLLSHTVAPWIDTVEQLQRYAEAHDVIAEKWHLLTGEKSEIYQLARQSYFAEMQEGMSLDPDSFLHTENLILIDGRGHIRGIYNGTLPVEVKRLIEDVHILSKEIRVM